MREMYLKQLLDYTSQQQVVLEAENIDAFGKLVEKKQIVFNKLEVYNNEHQDELNLSERSLVEAIQEVDVNNRKVFEVQFEEVKQKLRGIRRSKVGSNSYNEPYGVWQEEGIFFDKK